MRTHEIDRRKAMQLLAAATAAALVPPRLTAGQAPVMAMRKIPASGEEIPVIGMGSSDTFDVGSDGMKRAVLQGVLRNLADAGGSVIDTSPMYGSAESVLGDLIDELRLRPRLWLATKVWTRGREAGA